MRIALVGCGKQKLDHPAEARDLYQGTLFKAARAYAETMDDWYILSAKYGLLSPYAWTEPYDMTLADKPDSALSAWADEVTYRLVEVTASRAPRSDITLVLLAGEAYRTAGGLELGLRLRRDFVIETPLKGLAIGKQIQRLKELTP
jgi:cytoplasmic iron level regulating protein YaaA (DUF328/UPF0246 family)